MSSITLIHKVPAFWEVESKTRGPEVAKISDDFEPLIDLSKEEKSFIENLQNDIFFLLSNSLSDYLGIDHVNVVVGFDNSEVRNWDIIDRVGRIDVSEKLTLWSTNSVEKFPNLEGTKVIVLRGNYPHLHNEIISLYSPDCSIFYPATSLFFPHFSNRLRMWISKIESGNLQVTDNQKLISSISQQSAFSKIQEPDSSKIMVDHGSIELTRLSKNFFNSAIKISDSIRNRESPGDYSVVLFDEFVNIDTLKVKYPRSRLLEFKKAASPAFQLKTHENRDVDIIFTGTTIQRTKNQDLFYEIIDSLLTIRPETKISIIGVHSGREKLEKRWPRHNVTIKGRISPEDLCYEFNRSKIHLVTSGRDCFPRTIPESASCGCFNVALDILSDGLSIIRKNPIIGSVIDTSDDLILLSESHSVTLEILGDSIVKQLISHIDSRINPFYISMASKSLFNIEEMIQHDLIWESIDLESIKPR